MLEKLFPRPEVTAANLIFFLTQELRPFLGRLGVEPTTAGLLASPPTHLS